MRSADFQGGLYGKLKDYSNIDSRYSEEFSVRVIRSYIAGLDGVKKVLDVGCADGNLLSGFVLAHKIYGIDISRPLVQQANKKGLVAKVADLEKRLPFANKFFDVVVIHHVLEHIVDTDELLSEVNRVLKKEGRLLLTFPNSTGFVSIFMYLLDYPPYCGARYRSLHVRDFTLKTVRIALANNGFEAEENFGGSFLFLKNNFLAPVTKYLPRTAADITLECKKIKEVSPRRYQVYDFGIDREKFLKD